MKKNKQYWAGDHLEDVIEPKMPLLPFPSILREEASPTEAPKEITGEYTHGELAYFLDVSMPTLTKWRQKGLIPYNRDRHGKIRYKKKDVWVFVEKYNNSRQ